MLVEGNFQCCGNGRTYVFKQSTVYGANNFSAEPIGYSRALSKSAHALASIEAPMEVAIANPCSSRHLVLSRMRVMTKFVCLFSLFIASLSFAFGGNPPAISALEAAKIANDYLKEQAILDTTFIERITLEKAALLKSQRHWFVKWDAPLHVDGTHKVEIGLKVTMEGKVTRLVE